MTGGVITFVLKWHYGGETIYIFSSQFKESLASEELLLLLLVGLLLHVKADIICFGLFLKTLSAFGDNCDSSSFPSLGKQLLPNEKCLLTYIRMPFIINAYLYS